MNGEQPTDVNGPAAEPPAEPAAADAGAPAAPPGAEPAAVTPPPAAPSTVPSTVPSSAVPVAAGPPLPELTQLMRALGILALAGWSLGMLFGTLLLKGGVDRLVTTNVVGMQGRMFLLVAMAAGAAVALGAGAVAYLGRVRARGGTARMLEIAKRLSPLCLAGFLPYLFQWRAWLGHEMTFLFMVAAFSLSAWAAARAALASPRLLQGPRAEARRARIAPRLQPWHDVLEGRRWPQLPTLVVVAAAAGYAALFAHYTMTFHRNLRTAAYDLGLEDNLVYNVLHGIGFFRSTPFSGPTGSHFGNHATFFSYVLAPFYALSQGAHTLLLIQAILIGAAAIPLYLFARRHLPAWTACLIALFYLFYPPVHGANLYEFHYLPLGAFFLWSSLYFLEARRDRWAIVFVILTLSVREDVGADLSIIGAYLLISGERPRAGLLVAALGALHFVLLKVVIMPRVGNGESFVLMYKDLLPMGEQTYEGMMKTVVGNPFFMLGTLLERDKLFFLMQLFVPLAFLPLRRPLIILLLIPAFFFTLLSTGYAPLIQTSFQYTFHWTVFLFIGLVAVLAPREERLAPPPDRPLRNRARLIAVACAMIPASYQLGAIFQQHTARGGFATYNFETTPKDLADRATFAQLLRELPRRATVAASDNLVPQISNRPVSYTLRFSIFDADYVLFFSDASRMDGAERSKVTDALTSGTFGVVDVKPPFALAKRGHSTALNDRVLGQWGVRMFGQPRLP
jgi:uncharacterized membrane protein